MDLPLSLEKFAEICAEIDGGAARDEVLDREGIKLEIWAAAEELWPRRITRDVATTGELKRRYREAFAARRDALAAARERPPPAVSELEPIDDGPGAIALRAYAATANEASTDVDPAWVEGLEAATAFEGRAPELDHVIEPAAPHHDEPEPIQTLVPKSPALEDEEEDDDDPRRGTRRLKPIHLMKDPLPFKRDPEAPPSSRNELPPGVPSALPFRAPAPAASAAPAARAAPAPQAAPPAPAPRTLHSAPSMPLDSSSIRARGTFEVPNVTVSSFEDGPRATEEGPSLVRSAGLPFRAVEDPAVPSSAAPSSGAPKPTPFETPHAPFAALPQDPATALPFRQATQGPPILTIEQFAALSAEIAAVPVARAEIRSRYGLDDAAHRAEQDEWQRRFVTDSTLYAQYARLFQHYRDYFSSDDH